MIIIGLTGGIGSGKSTVAAGFKRKKIPVFDSDKEVRGFYMKRDAELIRTIKKIDPTKKTITKKGIDRKKLGDMVFNNAGKLKALEKTIYKKLKKIRKEFLKKHKKLNKRIVVLDTPLLFESKLNKLCNFIIFTKAPLKTRKKRALKREGMTKEKLKKIISIQVPESIKEKRSDFVIQTNKGKWYSYKQIKRIIRKISK